MQNVRGIYKTKPIKKDVHRSSMFGFMLTKIVHRSETAV